MKSRKMLAHNIFGSFATHACLVHATDCWAYNGSNHSCIFATFNRQFLTLRTTNKLLCVCRKKNPFLLMGVHDASLLQFPFKCDNLKSSAYPACGERNVSGWWCTPCAQAQPARGSGCWGSQAECWEGCVPQAPGRCSCGSLGCVGNTW